MSSITIAKFIDSIIATQKKNPQADATATTIDQRIVDDKRLSSQIYQAYEYGQSQSSQQPTTIKTAEALKEVLENEEIKRKQMQMQDLKQQEIEKLKKILDKKVFEISELEQKNGELSRRQNDYLGQQETSQQKIRIMQQENNELNILVTNLQRKCEEEKRTVRQFALENERLFETAKQHIQSRNETPKREQGGPNYESSIKSLLAFLPYDGDKTNFLLKAIGYDQLPPEIYKYDTRRQLFAITNESIANASAQTSQSSISPFSANIFVYLFALQLCQVLLKVVNQHSTSIKEFFATIQEHINVSHYFATLTADIAFFMQLPQDAQSVIQYLLNGFNFGPVIPQGEWLANVIKIDRHMTRTPDMIKESKAKRTTTGQPYVRPTTISAPLRFLGMTQPQLTIEPSQVPVQHTQSNSEQSQLISYSSIPYTDEVD